MKNISKYGLKVAGWEITYACNMRCKHCGSGCGIPKPDELSTEEALKLCDDLGGLKCGLVGLSGGEPLIRKDWHLIARRLRENNVGVIIVSNGWFINDDIVCKAIDAGVSSIAISLDGLEDTHDYIRTKGSFLRILKAFDLMRARGLPYSVITCLNSRNIEELDSIKEILIQNNVGRWQLQLAEPMGNLLEHPELILEPGDICRVIDYAYDVAKENTIVMDLADNIGYFDVKSTEIAERSCNKRGESGVWSGCQGGKSVVGIRCNGDVVPCLSIREDKFIEGNVRSTPIQEIWSKPGAFKWNREMKRGDLTGFCRNCQYADLCLGGCTTLKCTMTNSLYENRYCIYRVEAEREIDGIGSMNDFDELVSKARDSINEEQFQIAEICLVKALDINPNDIYAIDLLGFVKYSLDKYGECMELNKQSIKLNPLNAYAHKGLGICLAKIGRVDEGVELLRKSIELASDGFMEPYYDLAVVLDENGRTDEAIKVLNEGRAKSKEFVSKSEELLTYLKNKNK